MAARELVVLGTASQAPTRARSHTACFLRWDAEGILFDPGEGTQRQMLLAGIPASAITRVCLTHFHGDHCLGLPGVIQRLALDRVAHPVHLYYPASGQEFLDRLRTASIFDDHTDLRLHPVAMDAAGGTVDDFGAVRLVAAPLRHRVDAVGWRLEEPEGVRMLPARLEARGIRGPAVGELRARGSLAVGDRTVALAEVSVRRPGQVFAFVMDTAVCEGADRLAVGADLLVAESTFLTAAGEDALAEISGHMTARQAAELAARAGARRLVLTHFSQRHPDEASFRAEAEPRFAETVAATDLLRVPVPARR
ncbi:MAG TPA: ribonuclease Z [Actinomycetota bacterium]|nr:ribonuclease Z [Actinomycetota bacterium]